MWLRHTDQSRIIDLLVMFRLQMGIQHPYTMIYEQQQPPHPRQSPAPALVTYFWVVIVAIYMDVLWYLTHTPHSDD